MGNPEFEKVMRELRKQRGLTQAQREELARRRTMGEQQAKKQTEREERVKRLRKRKSGVEDTVIDSGMFD